MNFFKKKYFLAFLALLCISAVKIYNTFPGESEYYYGADEGVYLNQARTINEKGPEGFREIGDSYISNANEQVLPHPLRAGHLMLAAIALKINDSITSLSCLSLAAFIALCIFAFFFVERRWGEQAAFFAAALICFSPLASGVARRALMDAEVYLFFSLALFAFISYLEGPTAKKFFLFLALLTFSVLVKETAVLLLPFYAAVVVIAGYKKEKWKSIRQALLIFFVPVLAAGIIYLMLFGSVQRVAAISHIVLDTSLFISKPFPYVSNYMSGPWYQYFVDFFIVSPVVSILFFLFAGQYLSMEKKSAVTTVLLSFFAYNTVCLAFLSKDLRYALNLDLVYRIFAALMFLYFIKKIVSAELRLITLSLSFILILFLELRKYDVVFVKSKMYDPVAYNLLLPERFIPGAAPDTPAPAAPEQTPVSELEALLKRTQDDPTPENYFGLSFLYYRAGKFEESIKMANKAISLKPDYADAWNNIAAAYGAMQKWEDEIRACEKALQIDPNLQLAKNNLAWAQSQLKKK